MSKIKPCDQPICPIVGITMYTKFERNIGIYCYAIERELAEQLNNDFLYRTDILRGKILTIIEASIVDKEQQKAVKDMIHESFTNIQEKNTRDYVDYGSNINQPTIIISNKDKNQVCGSMPL